MSKELEQFIQKNLSKFDEVEQPDVEQLWADF